MMTHDTEERLRALEVGHVRMGAQLDSLIDSLKRQEAQLVKIDYKLSGNGTPGLVSRLDHIDGEMKAAKALVNRVLTVGWGIVALVLGQWAIRSIW